MKQSGWVWLGLLLAVGLFSQRDRLAGDETTPGAGARPVVTAPAGIHDDGSDALARAFEQRQSNLQLSGRGTVVKVLADDNRGSRHQRLLVKMASGQVILIAHNIDLAPRVADVEAGDSLAFHGEYEWTEKGGVMHWTHHDPDGRHEDGWLEHDGQRYQ